MKIVVSVFFGVVICFQKPDNGPLVTPNTREGVEPDRQRRQRHLVERLQPAEWDYCMRAKSESVCGNINACEEAGHFPYVTVLQSLVGACTLHTVCYWSVAMATRRGLSALCLTNITTGPPTHIDTDVLLANAFGPLFSSPYKRRRSNGRTRHFFHFKSPPLLFICICRNGREAAQATCW